MELAADLGRDPAGVAPVLGAVREAADRLAEAEAVVASARAARDAAIVAATAADQRRTDIAVAARLTPAAYYRIVARGSAP